MATNVRTDQEWVGVTHVALKLGISRSYVRRVAADLSIRRRELPGRNCARYNRADVEAALARLTAQEAAEMAPAKRQPRESGRIEKARTATL
jgi:hypothetical protein